MSAPNIPIPQTDFINPQTGMIDDVWWRYLRDPTFNSISTAVAIPVASGGTGLSSGVSGGIPGFTSASGMSSSALLTQYAIVLGGGAGAVPYTMATTGASTQVLHGNSSNPYFGSVVLSSDVNGVLPIANGGTNTSSALTVSSTIMVSDGTAIVQGPSGTTSTVLHGGSSTVPFYAFVNVGTEVTGTLAIVNGGTGATSAAIARTNLGLSSMAVQSSSAVAIVGGTINGTVIGNTLATTAVVSSLLATSGTLPTATVSGHKLFQISDIPVHSFVSGSQTLNNRIIDFTYQSGVFYGRFASDTYTSVLSWVEIVGGYGIGISSMTFGASTVKWNNPSHNSTHTFLSTAAFQGALKANGSATLGSSATFGMTVNATTVAWASTSVHSGTKIWSSTAQFNNRVQLATDALALQASSLFHGSGVPSDSNGLDGDYYFRSDGSVGAYIYFKTSAAWGAIV